MAIRQRTRLKRRRRCVSAFLGLSLVCAMAKGDSTPGSKDENSDSARIERLEKMLFTVMQENQRLAGDVRTLKQQIESQASVASDPKFRQAVETQPAFRLDEAASTQVPAEPAVTQVLAEPAVTQVPAEAPSPSLPAESVPLDFLPNLDQGLWEPMNLPDSSEFPESLDNPPSGLTLGSGRFRLDYDNGIVIVPFDPDEVPFSLRLRSQNVFRYNGFTRGEKYWWDSAGNRIPITDSNYFGIPRGRLIFSGMALFPELTYLLNIDYNSVTNNPIGFRAYVLSYRFSDSFVLSVGQSKVPGSREWLESAFAPLQGPDRSMATTFFRPSLSQGIWITGEPLEGLHYHAMISNGFNTLNQVPEMLSDRFCWSGSTWWEPLDEFGAGYSDLQNHTNAAVRMGVSYTYAIGRGSQSESDAVENSPIRLSDGTLITTPGALAPGVTLQSYDISLTAIDLAYKYRGLGLSTELYFQDLLGLKGNGPLPIRSTGAFGGFLQGGYFVIPQRGELYARSSYVTGDFGAGYEIGAGFNWYFRKGLENLRFTLDSAWLEGSPAGQNRTGYVAGQTGFLLRTQITAAY